MVAKARSLCTQAPSLLPHAVWMVRTLHPVTPRHTSYTPYRPYGWCAPPQPTRWRRRCTQLAASELASAPLEYTTLMRPAFPDPYTTCRPCTPTLHLTPCTPLNSTPLNSLRPFHAAPPMHSLHPGTPCTPACTPASPYAAPAPGRWQLLRRGGGAAAERAARAEPTARWLQQWRTGGALPGCTPRPVVYHASATPPPPPPWLRGPSAVAPPNTYQHAPKSLWPHGMHV